jgi:hypothetical protein
MKTQNSQQHTDVVGARPQTAFHNQGYVKRARICLFALVITLFSAALSQTAHAATPFNPVASAAQVMMQTQGDDAAFLANRFGVDPNSPLQYASSIDPSGSSFAFSLAPGTTYLGQPMTLTVSGTLNPSTQTWTVSSAGSLSGVPWTITKSMSVSLSGNVVEMNLTSSTQFNSGGVHSLMADIDSIYCNGVWYYNDNGWVLGYTSGLSPCSAYYEGNLVATWDAVQFTNTSSGGSNSTWNWENNSTELEFSVASSGTYLTSGGAGSFSTLVAPAKVACTSCSR